MRILLMLFFAFYVFAQNVNITDDDSYVNYQKIIREKIYNTRVQFQTCLFNYDMQLREHEFEYNLHISDVIHQIMSNDDKTIDVSKLQNLDYEIQRLQHEQKIISENIKNDSAIHCGIIEEELFNLEEELYNNIRI